MPWLQTSDLQNGETINFCCSKPDTMVLCCNSSRNLIRLAIAHIFLNTIQVTIFWMYSVCNLCWRERGVVIDDLSQIQRFLANSKVGGLAEAPSHLTQAETEPPLGTSGLTSPSYLKSLSLLESWNPCYTVLFKIQKGSRLQKNSVRGLFSCKEM